MTVGELIKRLQRAPKGATVVVNTTKGPKPRQRGVGEAYPHRYYDTDGKWYLTEFNLDLSPLSDRSKKLGTVEAKEAYGN